MALIAFNLHDDFRAFWIKHVNLVNFPKHAIQEYIILYVVNTFISSQVWKILNALRNFKVHVVWQKKIPIQIVLFFSRLSMETFAFNVDRNRTLSKFANESNGKFVLLFLCIRESCNPLFLLLRLLYVRKTPYRRYTIGAGISTLPLKVLFWCLKGLCNISRDRVHLMFGL